MKIVVLYLEATHQTLREPLLAREEELHLLGMECTMEAEVLQLQESRYDINFQVFIIIIKVFNGFSMKRINEWTVCDCEFIKVITHHKKWRC